MMLDLDVIEKRANAATPEPWKWHKGKVDPSEGGGFINFLYIGKTPHPSHRNDSETTVLAICGSTVPEKNADNNFAFIAHAREDIPALIAEVRRLREWGDKLAERLELCEETIESADRYRASKRIIAEYREATK